MDKAKEVKGGSEDKGSTDAVIFKDVPTEKLKAFHELIDKEVSRRESGTKPGSEDAKLSEMGAAEFAAYVDKTLSKNASRTVYRGTPPRHYPSRKFKKA